MGDPVTMGVAMGAGTALAPAVGGLVGNALSKDDRNAAEQAQKNALAAILGVDVPTLEKIYYESPELLYNYIPESIVTQAMGQTDLKNITTDPRLKQAQLNALEQYTKIGAEGTTPIEKAQLEDLNARMSQENQSRQAAIKQDRAERGISGGGDELAAQLSSAQAATQQQAQAGRDIMSQAQQRALQAIASQAGLAGQMNQEEYNQQLNKARAIDEINRFNTQLSNEANMKNVAERNTANQQREIYRQQLEQDRANLMNEQQKMNKYTIPISQNQMNMGKAAAASGQYGNISGYYGNVAANTAGGYAGIGSGVGAGIGSGINAYNQGQLIDELKKKNTNPSYGGTTATS